MSKISDSELRRLLKSAVSLDPDRQALFKMAVTICSGLSAAAIWIIFQPQVGTVFVFGSAYLAIVGLNAGSFRRGAAVICLTCLSYMIFQFGINILFSQQTALLVWSFFWLFVNIAVKDFHMPALYVAVLGSFALGGNGGWQEAMNELYSGFLSCCITLASFMVCTELFQRLRLRASLLAYWRAVTLSLLVKTDPKARAEMERRGIDNDKITGKCVSLILKAESAAESGNWWTAGQRRRADRIIPPLRAAMNFSRSLLYLTDYLSSSPMPEPLKRLTGETLDNITARCAAAAEALDGRPASPPSPRPELYQSWREEARKWRASNIEEASKADRVIFGIECLLTDIGRFEKAAEVRL